MKPRGLTLVELMVALAIAAAVLSLGIVTFRGYIPKQQLLSSLEIIANLAHRTQAEAAAKSLWSCLRFPDNRSVQAWLDVTQDRNCGNSGDRPIAQTANLRGSVILAPQTNPGCSQNITSSTVLWMDPTGLPQQCSGSGSPPSCVGADFQIVLIHPDLASNSRARELEITAGGLVQNVAPGSKGTLSSLWAKLPPWEENGCE